MAVTLSHVSFDSCDPVALATFWSAALDRPTDDADDADDADDRQSEVDRLVSLGATRLSDHDEWGAVWTVMADPQGNEFCVGQRQ